MCGLGLIFALFPPSDLFVEWREVRKKLPLVRQVVDEGPREGACSTSHIVLSLTMEELRAYCEILDDIDLKLMDKLDESPLGGEHNAVFFTREKLATGLRFPVLALVKQFLHFTLASLALVHPNIIRILTGCNVLNFLY